VGVVKKFRIFGKIFIMLEQITGEVVTVPKSKLNAMRKAKQLTEGEMLDRTVVSPAQMQAYEDEELKKKKLARLAMFKASAEKINPYVKKP
jgi:hypothetical protein